MPLRPSSSGRLQIVEPGPIPEGEMHRAIEWMQSWNMLDHNATVEMLMDATRHR